MVECSICDTKNPDKAKFCNTCGHKFFEECKKCSTKLVSNAKFCHECGTNVTTTSVTPVNQTVKEHEKANVVEYDASINRKRRFSETEYKVKVNILMGIRMAKLKTEDGGDWRKVNLRNSDDYDDILRKIVDVYFPNDIKSKLGSKSDYTIHLLDFKKELISRNQLIDFENYINTNGLTTHKNLFFIQLLRQPPPLDASKRVTNETPATTISSNASLRRLSSPLVIKKPKIAQDDTISSTAAAAATSTKAKIDSVKTAPKQIVISSSSSSSEDEPAVTSLRTTSKTTITTSSTSCVKAKEVSPQVHKIINGVKVTESVAEKTAPVPKVVTRSSIRSVEATASSTETLVKIEKQSPKTPKIPDVIIEPLMQINTHAAVDSVSTTANTNLSFLDNTIGYTNFENFVTTFNENLQNNNQATNQVASRLSSFSASRNTRYDDSSSRYNNSRSGYHNYNSNSYNNRGNSNQYNNYNNRGSYHNSDRYEQQRTARNYDDRSTSSYVSKERDTSRYTSSDSYRGRTGNRGNSYNNYNNSNNYRSKSVPYHENPNNNRGGAHTNSERKQPKTETQKIIEKCSQQDDSDEERKNLKIKTAKDVNTSNK